MPRLALTFSKFDNLRNYRAREGDGKSLPRGEGFRERVTCTKKRALGLHPSKRANPQIRTNVQ